MLDPAGLGCDTAVIAGRWPTTEIQEGGQQQREVEASLNLARSKYASAGLPCDY